MSVLKDTTKKLLYYGGFYHVCSGLDGLRHPGPRLIIVVYHNICDGRELQPDAAHPFRIRPVLTRSLFDQQLGIMKQRYELVDLETGLARLTVGAKSDRMVAVTFDDGYRSFLDVAFPVLQARGIPATVFLPTDFVGQSRYFWWDHLNQVVYLLQSQSPLPADLDRILGAEVAAELWSSRTETRAAARFLLNLERSFVLLSEIERERTLKSLEALLPKDLRARMEPEPTLDWNQVRALSKQGIYFGSHTCSHLTFGMATPESIESELKASRAVIENCLQKPVTGFAFPYGADIESYQKAVPILKRCGYTYARTTNWAYNTPSSNRFLLNRAHIEYQPSPALVCRDMLNNFLRRPEI